MLLGGVTESSPSFARLDSARLATKPSLSFARLDLARLATKPSPNLSRVLSNQIQAEL